MAVIQTVLDVFYLSTHLFWEASWYFEFSLINFPTDKKSDGSDTERALVKELASLRASSRLHSDSANTNGNVIIFLKLRPFD